MPKHVITAFQCREHRIECDSDGVRFVFETWLRKLGHVPMRDGKPVLRVKARSASGAVNSHDLARRTAEAVRRS